MIVDMLNMLPPFVRGLIFSQFKVDKKQLEEFENDFMRLLDAARENDQEYAETFKAKYLSSFEPATGNLTSILVRMVDRMFYEDYT